MVRNVAPLMRELESGDIYLLSGLEHGMRFSEWVDRNELPSYSGLDVEEVDYRLDRCLRFELIERRTMQYEGYKLLFEGYDALALHTFAEREVISSVGAPLGEGKESDVLEAMNDDACALKFHREGLTNFRRVDRERAYTADREHVSWLYTARKAAEREFEVLEALHPDVRVPAPIDQNRHAIVMERVPGTELARASLESDTAIILLQEILEELERAYRLGYVHTDASEYNIMVSSESLRMIDWPQAVSTEHPNADELLRRDLENVMKYFRRKHPSIADRIPETGVVVEHVRRESVADVF